MVLASQLIALFIVGGYRGTWRYFGIMDAVVFAKGVALGTVASLMIILYAYHFENYSRAVFVIYAALLLLLLTASRASFRLLGEFVHRRRSIGQRCVIYGTSGASVATIREAFGQLPPRIVGFADDDAGQAHGRVAGYPGGRRFRAPSRDDRRWRRGMRGAEYTRRRRRQTSGARARLLDHDVELVRIQLNLKRLNVAS